MDFFTIKKIWIFTIKKYINKYYKMEAQNISLIKSLLDKFLAGDAQRIIDGCHEDFYGKIWSGLILGGDEIRKEQLSKMFEELQNIWKLKNLNQ